MCWHVEHSANVDGFVDPERLQEETAILLILLVLGGWNDERHLLAVDVPIADALAVLLCDWWQRNTDFEPVCRLTRSRRHGRPLLSGLLADNFPPFSTDLYSCSGEGNPAYEIS